ncbi:hypothetical protein GOODEAATRI_023843, partial [Goodea atripinnis]
ITSRPDSSAYTDRLTLPPLDSRSNSLVWASMYQLVASLVALLLSAAGSLSDLSCSPACPPS